MPVFPLNGRFSGELYFQEFGISLYGDIPYILPTAVKGYLILLVS